LDGRFVQGGLVKTEGDGMVMAGPEMEEALGNLHSVMTGF